MAIALEGVCIQAVGAHGNAFAETDFDGSYSFGGLQPGSFTVQFTGCDNSGSVAPQYYNDESDSGSADPITLTAGQITTGIDAAMKPGATISGVVTDAAGHALSDVCVGIADQSEVALSALMRSKTSSSLALATTAPRTLLRARTRSASAAAAASTSATGTGQDRRRCSLTSSRYRRV